MITRKKILLGFATFGALFLILFLMSHSVRCSTSTRAVIVRGSSLHGIVDGGQEVKIVSGYYACNPIQRDDVVEYQYSGIESPLIKIVKGLPGDRWGLVKNERGLSEIFINGIALTNSFGVKYEIDELRARILQLYINDYKGIIPPDAYLILGNLPGGSVDSTKFGLVRGGELIGKVFIK